MNLNYMRQYLLHLLHFLWIAGLSVTAIGLGLVLGAIAVRDLAWGDTGDLLGSVNPALIVSALVLFLGAGLLRGLRWKLLLRPDRVSAYRLFSNCLVFRRTQASK